MEKQHISSGEPTDFFEFPTWAIKPLATTTENLERLSNSRLGFDTILVESE